MNKKLFWSGFFILSMLVLFVVMLFGFGLAARFAPKVYLESYFPESVQGLAEGAAVKYKGVPVGKVDDIAIRGTDQQIRVSMSVDLDNFQGMDRRPLFADEKKFGAWLQEEIAKGLRCRLDYAGITGMRYIELDYFDQPGLPPEAEPTKGVLLIPSAASPFKDIARSLNISLERIARIRFEEISDNLVHSLADLNRLLANPDLRAAIESLHGMSANLEASSLVMKNVLTESRLTKIAEDTETSLAQIRSLTQRLNDELQRSDIGAGIAAFQQAAEAVRNTALFVESRQSGLDVLLERVDRALEAVRSAAETWENDPSSVVRGRRDGDFVAP